MTHTDRQLAFWTLQEAFDYIAQRPSVAGHCEALRLIVEAQRKVFVSSIAAACTLPLAAKCGAPLSCFSAHRNQSKLSCCPPLMGANGLSLKVKKVSQRVEGVKWLLLFGQGKSRFYRTISREVRVGRILPV